MAELKHTIGMGSHLPPRVVGSLRMDNAGEFLSQEFRDFLDEEGIHQTTCPPHVHSLNGVAERAIRSIVENARAHMMVASNCPIGFWPQAFAHATEVLNRTTSTTPPGSDVTSHELPSIRMHCAG